MYKFIYIHTLKIFKLVNIFKLFLRLFNTVMILILRKFCCELFQITTLLLWSLLKSLFLHSVEVTGKQQI